MKFLSSSAFDFLFAVFFLLSLLINGDYDEAKIIIPIVMIIYHIWKALQFKASIELAFLLLFSLTYPLFWLIAVSLNVEIHYLFSYVNERLVAKAFSVQGLFLSCLFLGMRNVPPAIIALHPRKNSFVIFWASIIAMSICLVVAFNSVEGSIFDQSYSLELSGSSILFEYILILIIMAYSYSGEDLLRKNVLVLISILFVVAPLYFGKRLPASMVAFAILLLFWRPRSLTQVGGIFCAGFLLLSLLAVFRVGETNQSILHVLLNVGDHNAMRNNQGGVVYSSAAYIKLVEQGIFDFIFGVSSWANVMLSIFLPSSMVDRSAYINFSAMQYIPIPGNGGFSGVTFYIWGGVTSVVLIGFLLGRLIAMSRVSYLASVYVSLLFFTFPRWMVYNVNIIFKMGALLIFGWLIVRLVIYSVKRDNC